MKAKKQKEVKGYLHIMQSEFENLESAVRDIICLAQSFFRVGNGFVGHKLHDIALNIEDSGKNIRSAVDNKIDTDLKQAQENSVTIFKSVLAGMQIEKEGKP